LGLCARAGLVQVGVIAVDGTKISANASKNANRTYEQIVREILDEAATADAAADARLGDRRGDELPGELADRSSRRARLRAAKERLVAEARDARDARAAHLKARAELEEQRGRKLRARKPIAPPAVVDPSARANVTDPDCRLVRSPGGFVQGYNAQAVCTETQVIIAAELRVTTAFNRLLRPPGASVIDVSFGEEGVIVTVRLRRRRRVCSSCGQVGGRVHARCVKRWRHLDLGSTRCVIECELLRLDCRDGGVRYGLDTCAGLRSR